MTFQFNGFNETFGLHFYLPVYWAGCPGPASLKIKLIKNPPILGAPPSDGGLKIFQ
jgi:hypothetical protein